MRVEHVTYSNHEDGLVVSVADDCLDAFVNHQHKQSRDCFLLQICFAGLNSFWRKNILIVSEEKSATKSSNFVLVSGESCIVTTELQHLLILHDVIDTIQYNGTFYL